MKLFLKNRVAALLSFILLIGTTACDDSESAPPAKLQLQDDCVEASADAGSYTVSYELENPVSGAKLVAKCDQEWVHSFDTNGSGSLSFQVDENAETTPREAIVNLVYADAQASLRVKQEGAEIPSFSIALDPADVTEASVTYTVKPENQEMTYVSMVVEAAEFDSFESDEAYFQNDLSFFRSAAESQSNSLAEYLSMVLKKGELTAPVYNLKPEKTYYAYVYGLTPDGERTTGIYKQQFQTRKVEAIAVPFGITFQTMNSDVRMKVDPGSYEGYYMFDLVEASSVSDVSALSAMMQEYIDNYINIYSVLGVNAADAVTRFASKGNASFLYDQATNIKPNTEYLGFAVAITSLGQICSEPVTATVRTGDAAPDVDELAITLSDITSESVTVSVKSTIDDHYVVGITPAYVWEGMTDEDILATLVNGYQWQVRGATGDFETTFYGCQPKNRYSVLAFGYVNGESTTKLYRADFTAAEGKEANISFKFCYDKYFDGTELAELDPGFAVAKNHAVLPYWIETEGDELYEVYYSAYQGDLSDTQSHPDSDLLPELFEYGEWRMNGDLVLSYGVTYTIIGFSVNTNDESGPVSRRVIKLDRDGVSPAAEYGSGKAGKRVVVAASAPAPVSVDLTRLDRIAPASAKRAATGLLRPQVRPEAYPGMRCSKASASEQRVATRFPMAAIGTGR